MANAAPISSHTVHYCIVVAICWYCCPKHKEYVMGQAVAVLTNNGL